MQTVLSLPRQKASIEAANAVAYATRQPSRVVLAGRPAHRKVACKRQGQPEQASSSPLIHYSNTEDCCVSDRATGTWRNLPIGLLVDMRFLDRVDAAWIARKLERQTGKTSPQFTLFYTSGATDYSAAASAIVDALGAFNRIRSHENRQLARAPSAN